MTSFQVLGNLFAFTIGCHVPCNPVTVTISSTDFSRKKQWGNRQELLQVEKMLDLKSVISAG